MADDVLSSLRGLKAGDAASLAAEAKLKRAQADTDLDPVLKDSLRAEADALDTRATRLRDPTAFGMPELHQGLGGEVSTLPDSRMPLDMHDVCTTVQSAPDILSAEASLDRLTLARDAGVLTNAVEVAESVRAQDAIQQILAHEIAAGHKLFMRLIASATSELERIERRRVIPDLPGEVADAARTATAAARVADSVGRAALALDRLQNGGRQQVTVQHVVVGDGGQAVVAGHLDGAGTHASGRGRKGGGRLRRARDPKPWLCTRKTQIPLRTVGHGPVREGVVVSHPCPMAGAGCMGGPAQDHAPRRALRDVRLRRQSTAVGMPRPAHAQPCVARRGLSSRQPAGCWRRWKQRNLGASRVL